MGREHEVGRPTTRQADGAEGLRHSALPERLVELLLGPRRHGVGAEQVLGHAAKLEPVEEAPCHAASGSVPLLPARAALEVLERQVEQPVGEHPRPFPGRCPPGRMHVNGAVVEHDGPATLGAAALLVTHDGA